LNSIGFYEDPNFGNVFNGQKLHIACHCKLKAQGWKNRSSLPERTGNPTQDKITGKYASAVPHKKMYTASSVLHLYDFISWFTMHRAFFSIIRSSSHFVIYVLLYTLW